ncbi:uncharacterized protein LOC132759787 [Ruditapes philippinarum]|uniref:uncharacterized protein LOC132759787 n=1 Tax=Ruditapes philippinarum TaxID=129788 RepID=UPI00295BB736|nr:uncharacterized protein LOC132759787 [Ruditapes philippinarum]XP_060607619.1 uncharacterized protein LOC132759787 [Ruditapes philippinarum]
MSKRVPWVDIIEQPYFHTMFGANRQLLSKDGLHLSFDGTSEVASSIMSAVHSVLPVQSVPVPETADSHTALTETETPNVRSTSTVLSYGPRRYSEVVSSNLQVTTHLPTTETKPSRSQKRSNLCNKRSNRCKSLPIVLIETDNRFHLSTDCVKLVGGGNDVPMFTKTDRILTHHEAADILVQNVPDSITFEPPYRPANGSVYLFDDSGDSKKSEDWRADGYTWKNNGRRVYQSNEKNIIRTFFKISNQGIASLNFTKHVFRFLDDDYNNRTLIAYYGDSEAYQGLPHGNRKRNNRQHKRTKPSVMNNIKCNALSEKPKQMIDKMRSEASPESKIQGVSVPRNDKQIRNIQAKIRNENKLSHDSLYSLHILVEQLENYILSIKTTPDLEVILGNSEMLDELNRLLQLNDQNVELYYDTTFNLGDFYVSTLVCQHPMFKERPTVPIAFMLHERKFQKCHESFIEILKDKIPKLKEKPVNIIMDREQGILNAFEKCLPNSKILVCWNHIFSDIKFWVNKHGGTSDDKKVYDMHVQDLLHSQSRQIFDTKYHELKQSWSEAFLTYFDDNIYNTIIQYSGRWILEENKLYNPYSGITNNVVESLNSKLKRLIEYKEKAIDEIVMYLNYLQGNDLCEIIRGFCGESEWTLGDNFKYAARDPDTIVLPKNVCHPDKMIEMVKGEISAVTQTTNQMNYNSDSHDNDPTVEKIPKKGVNSQKSLAVKTIAEQGIVLVPEMGAFMVRGNKDNKYSVTLFPKESCSCPATSRCYHILAAMIAIGMPIPDDKKVFNLTQLRKNCRPKHSKKCGTKKGRFGDNDADIEINPAPDSVLKNTCEKVNATPKSKIMTPKNSAIRKNLKFDISTPKLDNTPTGKKLNKRKIECTDELSYKLPKLENDLSVIKEESEINNYEIRDNSTESIEQHIEYWDRDLGLTENDIIDLKNNKKLNSNHMEAVNIMLRQQTMGEIGGLQLTEKVPAFNELEKRWCCKFPLEPAQSPACQIHHNHHDHWVASFNIDNQIHLMDSLGNDRPNDRIIPNGLKIQLSQLYGSNKSSIAVNVPNVIKQNNSVDCGLYAIAFITSFCLRKRLCTDLIYDSNKIREHLLNCFERKEMTEFPLTKKTLSKRKHYSDTIINIYNYCLCNLPECLDDMVLCDKCNKWFHKNCINAPIDVSSIDNDFDCGLCS